MGGDAQRPVWHVNKPKKTGARTRGQNPLVLYNSVVSFKFVKNEASLLLLLLSEGGFVGWETGRRVLLPT